MKFADRIKALFGFSSQRDDEFYDELADLLVEGDLGAALAIEAVSELKKSCKRQGLTGEAAVKAELRRILGGFGKETRIALPGSGLNIILVLGVNGVGKTTSCAKLAHHFLSSGQAKKAILAAGDTFRAGAIEQLKIHGNRLGLRVVAQNPGADPGAVLFDALSAAESEQADLLIADTAGRMHTRQDLMRELEKIDRIIANKAPHARFTRLLVLDATTGQNGLRQAEVFSQAVPIDGVVLTKYDSSAKGGMCLSLAKEFGLATAFIGTGEGYADLHPFSLDAFLGDFLGIGS